MPLSSPRSSPVSPLSLPYISQVLDALDVSGNPLANEGVSALLLAHHALPAERPCRLRMEEVCVRPGSSLPLLLAKLSAGEPIEMQARSSEIEIERSRLPASHTPPCGTLCAHAHCCPPPLPLGVLPAAPRCTPSPHLGPRTWRRRARPTPLRAPCPRWPPSTGSPSRPRTSPSTASRGLSTRPARKRARPSPSRTWIQPISRSADSVHAFAPDFPPTALERGGRGVCGARYVLSCERVCPESGECDGDQRVSSRASAPLPQTTQGRRWLRCGANSPTHFCARGRSEQTRAPRPALLASPFSDSVGRHQMSESATNPCRMTSAPTRPKWHQRVKGATARATPLHRLPTVSPRWRLPAPQWESTRHDIGRVAIATGSPSARCRIGAGMA